MKKPVFIFLALFAAAPAIAQYGQMYVEATVLDSACMCMRPVKAKLGPSLDNTKDSIWTVLTAAGAPATATYVTQTADATLTNEQALGALSTGILKVTTTTGVISIALAGTDYLTPTDSIYRAYKAWRDGLGNVIHSTYYKSGDNITVGDIIATGTVDLVGASAIYLLPGGYGTPVTLGGGELSSVAHAATGYVYSSAGTINPPTWKDSLYLLKGAKLGGGTLQVYDNGRIYKYANASPGSNYFLVGNGTYADFVSASSARSALGLGTAALSSSSDFLSANTSDTQAGGFGLIYLNSSASGIQSSATVDDTRLWSAWDDDLGSQVAVIVAHNSSSASSNEYVSFPKPAEITTLRTAEATAADAGVIRLANGEGIYAEASPAGTDGSFLFNSSEVWTSSTPISATTGYQVGGAAALGNKLVGNATNFVPAKTDTIANLTGDVTTTNTTATRVSGLTLYMAASTTWRIRAILKVGSSSAAGTKYAFDIPTSASMFVKVLGTTSVAGTTTAEWVTADATLSTTAFNTAALTTAAVGAFIEIDALIINGANAGNFEIMQAKVTSGTATIYTGSYLDALRQN